MSNNRLLSQPFGLLLGILLLAVFCCSLTPKAFAEAFPADGGDPAAKASLKPLYTAADKTPSPLDEAVLSNALLQLEPPAPAPEPEPEPEPEPAPEPSGIMLDVPTAYSANTGFKSYMDYRALTNRRSKQYALQQNAYTDEQGFRIYDGCYMVALGTYYAQSVGERFRITLDSGKSFLAVAGDVKSNAHTDRLHQHRGGNIVEFIVDTRAISSTCRRMGDMSYAGFSGRIQSIEKLN